MAAMTAPTRDERREVAERLRVYSHDFDFGDANPFWYVAKAAFGDVDAHTYHSVFARLADLIDPTCYIVPFDEESMRLPHCSRCGQPMLKPWPNFCPNCGARVVSGDD